MRRVPRTHRPQAALLACLALGLAACSPPADDAGPSGLGAATVESIRLRAVSGFARGWLSKPAGDPAEQPAVGMAPLLIHATAGAAPLAATAHIGEVSRGSDGTLSADPARPTLYYSRSTTRIAGVDHDQWSYVWWNAASADDPRVAAHQGIRMTVDASGSPMVWEVLTDRSGARLFFVDRALEEAASARVGPPHPGREFSLERTLEETPDVLIVRLIESGATPLGPFVHVAEDGRDVHTLLCRCMPSEVDEIVGIDEYALLPADALQAVGVEARFGNAPDELETLLRFPGPDSTSAPGE